MWVERFVVRRVRFRNVLCVKSAVLSVSCFHVFVQISSKPMSITTKENDRTQNGNITCSYSWSQVWNRNVGTSHCCYRCSFAARFYSMLSLLLNLLWLPPKVYFLKRVQSQPRLQTRSLFERYKKTCLEHSWTNYSRQGLNKLLGSGAHPRAKEAEVLSDVLSHLLKMWMSLKRVVGTQNALSRRQQMQLVSALIWLGQWDKRTAAADMRLNVHEQAHRMVYALYELPHAVFTNERMTRETMVDFVIIM